jgi:FkbM family methyltransferase
VDIDVKESIKKTLISAVRCLFVLTGRNVTRRVLIILREALSSIPRSPTFVRQDIVEVSAGEKSLSFYCLGELSFWRAETLLTKEPETIEWLDSMQPEEVLWDIGANVGLYTVYGAAIRGLRVFAFEPSAGNLYLLNRNIALNGLTGRAQAVAVALSDEDQFSDLHMHNMDLGGSESSFHDPVDYEGNRFEASFKQGVMGYTIDSFVQNPNVPFPNHIKIDVDGIEDRIIKGAAKTLRDPRLKSLSVELDDDRPEYTNAVIKDIEDRGLTFIGKRHGEMFDGTKYERIYNYLFRRS